MAQAPTMTEQPEFPWLQNLNEAQSQAVLQTDGPVLVLAGAGTGKTRVLTTRLAHILMLGKARPQELLAVTFTNKAAREMKERVESMINHPTEGWWLGTFHALAARMLRRHAELVGLNSQFSILDTDDQERLIKQILNARSIDTKRWTPKTMAHLISRWKDRGWLPSKIPAAQSGDFANGQAVEIYQEYQDRLKVLNAVDFGDLLLLCLDLFSNNADVLARYHRQFKYILVDEYQDTNVAQYLWLRLLAQGHKNICCVGDDDQSIYGWRGAEVGNILRFEKDFPGAAVVRLECNYRSSGHILAAASKVIAYNEGRLGKELFTNAGEGEKVVLKSAWDGEEEARQIGEEIERFQSKGTSLADMAILVRASFQMREFEERFITLGIPYRVIGGPRFYERMEIRDALAYLRVVQQPDDDLAFERIINKPKRGIGDATVQMLYTAARASGRSLYRATEALVQSDELRPKVRSTLSALLNDFQRWRDMSVATPHPELTEILLDESGYTTMWREEKSPDAQGRLENLKELISAMGEFENLPSFLEHVSLVMEAIETGGEDRVTIMTLHGAKGLEFDVVFLPGWEEGVFPNQRALDETGVKGLEEERRLAYVGITRARKHLNISYAGRRRIHGQYTDSLVSRFVEELPKEHIDDQSSSSKSNGSDYGGFGFNFTPPQDDGPTLEKRKWGWQSSPGWQRAQARRAKTIDGKANVIPPTSKPQAFNAGDRVFHQKFGYGTVLEFEGDKLVVGFDHSGEKRVMAGFVQAAQEAS
jgi:DNA helicase II / ATP-dependent DNA helicase PcrA